MQTNKLLIPSIITCVAVVILGICIYKGLNSFAAKERVVTVKGLSERTIDVDYANLNIKYVVGGNIMSEVLAQIETNNKIIKDFAISKGLSNSEITFAVPNIKDKENQEYGTVNQNERYRYYATVKVSFISNKVKQVYEIETSQFKLMKEGINLIQQPDYDYYGNQTQTYTFTQLNKIKPEMIKESITNAKKSADEFAQSSNSKVKKIKSARQGQFEIVSTDNPLKVKIRVVSTIDYFIN